MEVLDHPRITIENCKMTMDIEKNKEWMDDIITYKENGVLHEDDKQARTICEKSKRFVWKDGYLGQISSTSPLLKYIGEERVKTILEEIHEGDCRSNVGTKNPAHKAFRSGYYLPTMYQDLKICGRPACNANIIQTFLESQQPRWFIFLTHYLSFSEE